MKSYSKLLWAVFCAKVLQPIHLIINFTSVQLGNEIRELLWIQVLKNMNRNESTCNNQGTISNLSELGTEF